MRAGTALVRSARPYIVIAILLALVVGLQGVRERAPLLQDDPSHILYVQSPEAMKRLALSYKPLLADIYWIRAVQHYGGTKLSNDPNKKYDLLYPLLDLTTSLDPRFNVAYQFGAAFLSEQFPAGPGRPDQAIGLLQKGLKTQPDRWEFAQAIGFVYYWSLTDYSGAAEWFRRASEMPNAPIWMAPLAAVTLAEGGSRQSSRLMWQQFAKTADDDWFRKEAERRLTQLDAMDQRDQLRRLVAVYRERTGTTPATWNEMMRAGYLRGIPADPTGIPYALVDGDIDVGPDSTLRPLPKEAASR